MCNVLKNARKDLAYSGPNRAPFAARHCLIEIRKRAALRRASHPSRTHSKLSLAFPGSMVVPSCLTILSFHFRALSRLNLPSYHYKPYATVLCIISLFLSEYRQFFNGNIIFTVYAPNYQYLHNHTVKIAHI